MTQMRITDGKGVHFNLDNGWTLSVQIGGGNYSENYDFSNGDISYDNPLPPSSTAEIAIWNKSKEIEMINLPTGGDYTNTVMRYVPVTQILELIPVLSALPNTAVATHAESAIANHSSTYA